MTKERGRDQATARSFFITSAASFEQKRCVVEVNMFLFHSPRIHGANYQSDLYRIFLTPKLIIFSKIFFSGTGLEVLLRVPLWEELILTNQK